MSNFGIPAGTIVGDDFEIVRPLSAGGMGSVYVARQRSIDMLRALKLMNLALVADTALRDRFTREARISASIGSEHVVQVINTGVDAKLGVPWIAMELLEGSTLAEHVQQHGPLEWREATTIWLQFCSAITAAHDRHIIHRDIKPENVFLARSRIVGMPFLVKVFDFGIAKMISENRANTFQAGSPLYMAPEQTSSTASITPRTDVWAMGLFAFFLLTGKHFWQSAYIEGARYEQVLCEAMINPIPPASVRAAEYGRAGCLPEGFDAWFARCVARQPEQRFNDAAELSRTLAGLLGARASGAFPDLVPPVKTEIAPVPLVAPVAIGTMPGAPLLAQVGEAKGAPVADTRAQTAAPVGSTIVPNRRRTVITGMSAAMVLSGVALAGAVIHARGKPPPAPPGMVAFRGGSLSVAAGALRLSADKSRPEPAAITLQPFALDSAEVAVADYQQCVAQRLCPEAAPLLAWDGASEDDAREWSKLCNGGKAERNAHPINCVTWDAATAYCAWVGKRLPTSEEWEFAVRGAEGRAFPWGAEPPSLSRGNVCDKDCHDFASGLRVEWEPMVDGSDGYAGTAPVGSFRAGDSPEGVHDLIGNVSEWTSSRMCDPSVGGAACTTFAVRGAGCQTTRSEALSVASQRQRPHDYRSINVGFRCAISL